MTAESSSGSPAGSRSPLERPLGLRHLARVPEHCVWEITNACNLRCVHCESESGLPRPAELTTAEALALCEDLGTLGCETVNLSGGEPFLRSDWELIVGRLTELGMAPVLVSNLTTVGTTELEALSRLGVEWVATSVDGPAEVHDRIRRTRGEPWSAFARTVSSIARLKERGHQVAVITHVSLWNLPHLDELVRILAALRVDSWQLQIGQPSGRLRAIADSYLIYPRQLEELYALVRRVQRAGELSVDVADDIGFFGPEELEVRSVGGEPRFFSGCPAGYRVLSIASDGTVRGCPSLEIDVGNLRETPLVELWADEGRFAFNRFDPEKIEGHCRRCSYRRICRSGCKGLALATTGSLYRNIYCVHQLRNLGGDPDRREVGGVSLPPGPSCSRQGPPREGSE